MNQHREAWYQFQLHLLQINNSFSFKTDLN